MKLPTDQDILAWLGQFAPAKDPNKIQMPGLLEQTAIPMQALPQGARVMDSGEILGQDWQPLQVQNQAPQQVLGDIGNLLLGTSGGMIAKPKGALGAGPILQESQATLKPSATQMPELEPTIAQLEKDFAELLKVTPTSEQLVAKQELLKAGVPVETLDGMPPTDWPIANKGLKDLEIPQPAPQPAPSDWVYNPNTPWIKNAGEAEAIKSLYTKGGVLEQKPYTALDELKTQGWMDNELADYSPTELQQLVKNLYGKDLPHGDQGGKLWQPAPAEPLPDFGPMQIEPDIFEPSRPRRFEYTDEFIGPPAPQRDLPMDTASRLQRAADMGFDLENVYYSGAPLAENNTQIKAWADPLKGGKSKYNSEAGIFLSDNPRIASDYYTGSHGTVQPVYLRAENPRNINWTEYFGTNEYSGSDMKRLINDSRERGHDVLHINDISDVGGLQKQTVLLEPNRARSPFARFDPKNIDANDLIASLALAFGLGGAAKVMPEDKK